MLSRFTGYWLLRRNISMSKSFTGTSLTSTVEDTSCGVYDRTVENRFTYSLRIRPGEGHLWNQSGSRHSQCRGHCPGSKSSSPMRNSLSTVLVVKKRNGIGDEFPPSQVSVFSIPWILDMDFFRSVCTLNTSILVKDFKRFWLKLDFRGKVNVIQCKDSCSSPQQSVRQMDYFPKLGTSSEGEWCVTMTQNSQEGTYYHPIVI